MLALQGTKKESALEGSFLKTKNTRLYFGGKTENKHPIDSCIIHFEDQLCAWVVMISIKTYWWRSEQYFLSPGWIQKTFPSF